MLFKKKSLDVVMSFFAVFSSDQPTLAKLLLSISIMSPTMASLIMLTKPSSALL